MYLKALNVVGFKSFADKTQVLFHPGVTAIVGPNGCGKSNVLDSIRWVLGEQSAKALRGGQMQDVIFNGAETRKPLGMAEVSLTFGDCEGQLGTGALGGADYNEVTITRRLFRDGASEYEINKNPCRLRDIHQLFMDTGVGRTAYSIMEQGKIDQILSARPEDRRAVFEEAAGITKFKSQKKEAMRKLENTEANLVRLEDIVGEVRRQIGSLQRQAGKARRYQELFAELKEAELKLARHQYALLNAEIASLQERGDAARDGHAALTLAVEEEDRSLGALRGELELLEAETARVRDLLNEARNAAERGALREKTNAARVEEFGLLRENCRIEIAGTDEKIRVQDAQLAELSARLEAQATARLEASNAYHATEQEVREVEERLAERESARAEKRHELAAGQSKISNLRNQRVALEAQQKNLLLRGESLRSEQDALALRRAEAEARRAAQLDEVAAAARALEEARAAAAARQEVVVHRQQAVAEAQQVVAGRQQRIGTAQQAVAAAQEEAGARQRLVAEREQAVRAANDRVREAERAARDLATAHARVAAKLEALRQLEASHAGSPPAAQHLLACGARGEVAARLQGTLSDHFQVAPGAETAVALLLGEAFNALVVDDRAGAEELLRKLAEQGEGQVFLAPLGLPRPSGLGQGAATAARRAVEVADPALSDLLDALLADAHIVDGIADAWALKAAQPQAVVATRDGLLLSRAGLIQAGKGAGQASALAVLARRDERRALEEEVAAAARAAEAGAARVAEAGTGVQEAQAGVDEAQRRVEEARAAVAAAQGGVGEAQAFVAEARGFVQEAQDAVAAAQADAAEAQGAVRDAEIQAATRRHSQETLVQAVAELDRGAERIAQEAARVAAQVEADAQRFAGIDAGIAEAEAHAARSGEELAALDGEVEALEQDEAAKRQELVESQIALGALTHQHQAVAQQQFTVQQRLAELKELAATRAREAGDYATRVAEAEREIAAAKEEQEAAALAIAGRETELQGRIAARSEKLEAIGQRETALRAERKKLSDVQSQQAECEVRLTERRIGLSHLVERVQGAYQLVLSELPPLAEEEVPADWAAVEAQVAEQREKIDGMGPVNIEAIAEFEELQERLTFLEGQEADLKAGKEQLLQAIQEINQTTEKMFAETFEQVKVNFQQLFGELFGGGKATLHLSDDKDPLESGIEITAKPPGKQPQSITLLSGGEKTMTAVALLFAIYMVKPSPFCVLDELDAPLDESNINRFINIVKRFTEHSQFVVITHNKRTISMADAIFGVTMQERGVSRLMSVKLTSDEEYKPRPARQAAPKPAAAPAPEAEAAPDEGGVAVLDEEPEPFAADPALDGGDDDGERPALEG